MTGSWHGSVDESIKIRSAYREDRINAVSTYEGVSRTVEEAQPSGRLISHGAVQLHETVMAH